MTPGYSVQYALAWINAAAGIVSGALAAAYLTIHPSWLNGDIAATAGIVVPITVGLAQILPPLQRTPAKRETQLLQAAAGVLPPDLAAKHPTIATAAARPLDTL